MMAEREDLAHKANSTIEDLLLFSLKASCNGNEDSRAEAIEELDWWKSFLCDIRLSQGNTEALQELFKKRKALCDEMLNE